MKSLAILLAVGISMSAYADELTFTTLSYHSHHTYKAVVENGKYYYDLQGNIQPIKVEEQRTYNNENWGIGYELDNGVEFGAYRNSYYKPTFYLAYEYMLDKNWGAAAGLDTGYEFSQGHKVSVLAGFVYKHDLYENVGAKIMFIPPIGRMSGLANLTITYKLAK